MDVNLALFILFICFNASLVSCQVPQLVEIDLSGYTPNDVTKTVYQKPVSLSQDVTQVHITNIEEDVGFFVMQVHSYVENVTLSYNSTLQAHLFVTGTNLGLIYGYGENSASFYIFRDIKYRSYASVLLVVTIYDSVDPIPGGCNLSFTNTIAPYQIVSYNDDYITVESQPPYADGANCDDNVIEVEMYRMFLSEYDNSESAYFEGVQKMLTVDSIKKYGKKVPSSEGYNFYHRLFSLYKGTGEIFAIVATYGYTNTTSAYVPAVSYGCNVSNWDESCVGPVTRYWKFICALLVVMGLLTCFYGHKYFKLTLFMMSFAFGILLTYLVISVDSHFGIDEKMVTSIIVGVFYGIVWIFIWWKFGVPVLSSHISFILGGCLVASIVFHAGLADLYIYRFDINYWITFTCIVLACLLLWVSVSMYGHIFVCSFLGSYAFLTALNYYLGGNMQYIVINTYRRATVNYFSNAVISPPFQIIDIVHSVSWVILVVTGCYVQLRDQKGKPPFPPNRNGVVSGVSSERTRLIAPESESLPQYV